MKKYISKEGVKKALGRGFDDDGLLFVDIEEINKLIEYYLEFSD